MVLTVLRVSRHLFSETEGAWQKAIRLDRFVGSLLPRGLVIQ